MQNDTVKNLLNKYGIKPQKRLGQNFLIDESVLEKIIAASELSKDDVILEIGPGLGILTIELAKRVKRVIAVEKDKTLYRALENILEEQKINNIEMLNEDVLQISNYSNLPNCSKYKIVANLPYYIVSPVIRMFLENPPLGGKPEFMILMVQKEVAQRICARPGQMSILAVAVQFYAQPKIVSEVLKTSFYPQPKVDSAVIKITPRINTNPITNNREFDTGKFFGLVRAGFAHKRKLLISNVSGKIKNQKSKIKIIFNDVGIAPTARAENLSIENWINLYEKIKNNL